MSYCLDCGSDRCVYDDASDPVPDTEPDICDEED